MSEAGRHIIAQGRVQGVGFRYFCQREAIKAKITGFVKNLTNDDVEIIAEGDETRIEIFISNIQNNHPYAIVNNLIQKEITFSGEYREFSIRF